MRKYRPLSYSKQARKLAEQFFMWEDKEEALKCLKNTYRGNLIKHRAIKNFMRKYKKEREV